jgi:hypothetical protein
MDKEERKKLEQDIERKAYETYPLWKRAHWDEWGSPVGLSLGWALFIVPLGLFIWLLHLANLIG